MTISTNNIHLTGRRCLVTGAAGGIGAEVSRLLCALGAEVVLGDLDTEELERLRVELAAEGFTVYPLAFDVTNDRAVADATATAAELLGGLDTLIANAGTLYVNRIERTSLDEFRRTLEVNLVGTFISVRHALPFIRGAGGGAIVCTASHAGIEGAPEFSAYCASKFGVVGLVQALARELAPEQIRVNAVAPGLIDTPMLSDFFGKRATVRGLDRTAVQSAALAAVPMGRLGDPYEVAGAIAFLISDLASYISGVTLPVLGGEISR
jgi:NAD(P)-dependent dehydrogenase (short-subunit alcohol dehydrogenase family)